MTDLSIKELCTALIFLGSLIGALSAIGALFTKMLKKVLEPVQKQLRKIDVSNSRIFLVGFLCDLEQGVEKDEVQWKLAHEIYDHYTDDLKENSYVHDKWERVVNNVGNQ